VIAVVLTLVALEGLLRVLLERSRLYGSFHTVPALNQWKQEVKFWEKYHNRERPLSSGHDLLLGWDFDAAQDRIRGSRLVSQTPAGGQPSSSRVDRRGPPLSATTCITRTVPWAI